VIPESTITLSQLIINGLLLIINFLSNLASSFYLMKTQISLGSIILVKYNSVASASASQLILQFKAVVNEPTKNNFCFLFFHHSWSGVGTAGGVVACPWGG
jgi:hypothetical protein